MSKVTAQRTHTVRGLMDDKWWIGSYRHAMPYPKSNLYLELRMRMGLTQRRAAALFGITPQAWRYRERVKRMYHAAEVVALYHASGMSCSDFMKLLSECA